jgi:hypothetical protein
MSPAPAPRSDDFASLAVPPHAQTQLKQRAQVPHKRRIVASLAFLLIVLVCDGVWVYRAPLLRAAANAWIVSDEASPADAVAVLGGGLVR